jgi:hypothetical protein
MDKKYWENREITVYWWNMGTKTLDYRGPYKGFLKLKGIKVRAITRNGTGGFRFTIPLLSTKAILDTYTSDYYRACDQAIEVFLTLLGDKTKFIGLNREFNINW